MTDAAPAGLPDDVLAKAVSLLMSRGGDFGDVFVERATVDSIGSDDRRIDTTTRVEQGVGLRVVTGGRTFYGYTDSFAPDRVYETARTVASAAAAPAAGTAPPVVVLQPVVSPLAFPILPPPDSTAASQKIEEVRALTERAWSAAPSVIQVLLMHRETLRRVDMATSDGRLVHDTLGLTEFFAQVHVRGPDGDLQSADDQRGAYAGRDFFVGQHAFEAIVDRAADKAARLLEAVDAPHGTYPVVFAPGMNGVLFHESCGHGMEADLVSKGSSFQGRLGQQTAARGVTLVDDGTIPALPGSSAFDDEATPSQRTVLIEDGIQRGYLCDRIFGAKLDMPSTGNCRRESFRHPPIPRMRNTFIERGQVPAGDIVAGTKRGLYVADVGGGGQVDVISGHFMMGVGSAYLIEDGHLTRPVKGATISGVGIEALRSIDLVGDDLMMFPSAGRCGKWQAVPVGFGMPTVRARSVLVGGKGPAWTDLDGGWR